MTTDQPRDEAATCTPACSEGHTYALGTCALSCKEIGGGIADMSWTVPCPWCKTMVGFPCYRPDGSAYSGSHGHRWDAYEQAQKGTPAPDAPAPGWIARLSTSDDDRSQITETTRGGRRLAPAPDVLPNVHPISEPYAYQPPPASAVIRYDTTAPDGDGQAGAVCHCGLGTRQQCATEPWGCAHDREHAPKAPQSGDAAPAFTWAESVASYGIGPTATVDIDVHAPGHDEPVPVEIPLAKARELYAHLGGILAEHGVTPRTARLRERLERAYTEGFRLSCQITDLRCELTDERTRAEQAEAALARVRAECHAIGTDVCNAATRILAALTGPANTPNGDTQ